MKKLPVLLLAACLLFIPACRRSDPDTAKKPGATAVSENPSARADILTGVYRAEALAVPGGDAALYVSRFAATVPGLDPALGMVSFYMQNDAGEGYAVTSGAGSGVIRETPVPLPDGLYYTAGVFIGDCLWYVAAETEVDRMAMFEDDVVMILCCLDCASGEMREIADLRPLFDSAASSRYGCHVSAVVADADGDLWIGTSEEIVVVSPEGEKRCSAFGLFNQPMRLAAAPDGTVWLAETARILIFDKQTPDQVRRLTPEIPPDRIVFAGEHAFCFSSSAGIWGADLDEEGNITAQLLMNYTNSGVDPLNSALLGTFGEEAFLLGEATAEGRSAPVLYRASEDVSLASLSVLEVAFSFNPEKGGSAVGFTTAIVEYNKAHPDRRILTKDYSVYNTAQNPEGGENRLVMDMLTGVYRPDIVVTETRSTRIGGPDGIVAEQIAEKHLYTDLAPFLDADDTVNRETVFGAIQRFFATEDGGMWGIAPAFQINTLLASPLLIGQYADGWTLAELLDFIETLPADAYLMAGLTQNSAAEDLLGPDGYAAFVDRKSASCSFDSPEFLRWLRFYASLPAEYAALSARNPPMDELRGENLEEHWTGRVALSHLRLYNGFRDLAWLEATFGTKDWIVPGFPMENGSGTSVECRAAIVMTSFCREPDFAWEIIRSLVSETLSAHFDYPALKPYFRGQAAQMIDNGGYETITFDGRSRSQAGGYAEDGVFPAKEDLRNPGWIMIPTWEDFEKFSRFLDERAGYPMTESLSPEISSIVAEEISAFAAGVGSAEDCAGKIQARVSIWLAEHS